MRDLMSGIPSTVRASGAFDSLQKLLPPSMQLMEDWKSTAAEVYHSLLPWADLIEVRWFVVSKQRILMV